MSRFKNLYPSSNLRDEVTCLHLMAHVNEDFIKVAQSLPIPPEDRETYILRHVDLHDTAPCFAFSHFKVVRGILCFASKRKEAELRWLLHDKTPISPHKG